MDNFKYLAAMLAFWGIVEFFGYIKRGRDKIRIVLIIIKKTIVTSKRYTTNNPISEYSNEP